MKILPWTKPLRIAIIGMLVWALLPSNPYGYYILLRWCVCGVLSYLAVAAYRAKHPGWLLLFIIAAGVYNPIFPLHLGRSVWSIVNIATIALLGGSLFNESAA